MSREASLSWQGANHASLQVLLLLIDPFSVGERCSLWNQGAAQGADVPPLLTLIWEANEKKFLTPQENVLLTVFATNKSFCFEIPLWLLLFCAFVVLCSNTLSKSELSL